MWNKYKTHCKNGHPFSVENTWIRPANGQRRCRICHNASVKKDYATKPAINEATKRRALTYYAANRDKCRAAQKLRDRSLDYLKGTLKRYKLTMDDYLTLYELQGFKCKICKGEKKLFVDHNHATGKVRGLLCHGCNSGIGLFGENTDALREAADYLEREN